ncbi:MAG: DegQ family serine endoprotease [Alphaproteobacteria bacterium]|nr:DegQ family serine endoprotease [Alphaproteobacteria bacterium]
MTDKPTNPLHSVKSSLDGLKQRFKPRHRRAVAMGSAAAIVVVGLGAFGFLPPVKEIQTAGTPILVAANQSSRSTPRMLESSAPFSFADLVERVSPAVVSITSETTTTDGDMSQNIPEQFRDLFQQFGQKPQPHRALSAGSGFIIDKAGYVVTNNHVVDASKKITVKLQDGRSFTAKLIGTDPATDVALLKIDSDKPLPSVEFGNDKNLRVGDWVVAVGNPFGLSNSVTAGIVSSLGRDIESSQPYTNFIQIDAPINRGNSGGPTFDLRGQVVGMNSMIFSPTGGSVGIGFAIPASVIQDVIAQLKESGHVTRGWLGVSIQSVTPDIADSLGLKSHKGALVAEVVPGGPAAKSGFKQGDIVSAIDGQPVEDSHDLTRKVAAVQSGKVATFSVNRGGKLVDLKVTIGTRPDEKLASNGPSNDASPSSATAAGLGLSSLTPQARRMFNLGDDVTNGAVITKVDPNSDAADKGLQPGDVVLKINNRDIKSPEDFQSGVAEAQKGGRKSVLLLVARSSGATGFVAIDIDNT